VQATKAYQNEGGLTAIAKCTTGAKSLVVPSREQCAVEFIKEVMVDSRIDDAAPDKAKAADPHKVADWADICAAEGKFQLHAEQGYDTRHCEVQPRSTSILFAKVEQVPRCQRYAIPLHE